MIYIKNNQNSNTVSVSLKDKHIGSVGENLSKSRFFCLPKFFHDLNLSDDKFAFVLQVKPIDNSKPVYLNLLMRLTEYDVKRLPQQQKIYLTDEIMQNSIFLKWEIQKFDLVASGNLQTSIKIFSYEDGEIGKTYICEFYIARDVMDIICDIEPICIFDQVLNKIDRQIKDIMILYNNLMCNVILEVFSALVGIKNNLHYLGESIIFILNKILVNMSLQSDEFIDKYNQYVMSGNSMVTDINNNLYYLGENIIIILRKLLIEIDEQAKEFVNFYDDRVFDNNFLVTGINNNIELMNNNIEILKKIMMMAEQNIYP